MVRRVADSDSEEDEDVMVPPRLVGAARKGDLKGVLDALDGGEVSDRCRVVPVLSCCTRGTEEKINARVRARMHA